MNRRRVFQGLDLGLDVVPEVKLLKLIEPFSMPCGIKVSNTRIGMEHSSRESMAMSPRRQTDRLRNLHRAGLWS